MKVWNTLVSGEQLVSSAGDVASLELFHIRISFRFFAQEQIHIFQKLIKEFKKWTIISVPCERTGFQFSETSVIEIYYRINYLYSFPIP